MLKFKWSVQPLNTIAKYIPNRPKCGNLPLQGGGTNVVIGGKMMPEDLVITDFAGLFDLEAYSP